MEQLDHISSKIFYLYILRHIIFETEYKIGFKPGPAYDQYDSTYLHCSGPLFNFKICSFTDRLQS